MKQCSYVCVYVCLYVCICWYISTLARAERFCCILARKREAEGERARALCLIISGVSRNHERALWLAEGWRKRERDGFQVAARRLFWCRLILEWIWGACCVREFLGGDFLWQRMFRSFAWSSIAIYLIRLEWSHSNIICTLKFFSIFEWFVHIGAFLMFLWFLIF